MSSHGRRPWIDRASWKPGLGRRDIVVLVLLLGMAFLFLFPYLFNGRITARRRLCDYRQMSLGRALLRYEARFGEFPAYRSLLDTSVDDARVVGWAYAILPYVGVAYQKNLPEYLPGKDQRLGPWSDVPSEQDAVAGSTSQRDLSSIYIPDLVCPEDLPPHLSGTGNPVAWSSYVVNAGLPDRESVPGDMVFPVDWPANGVFLDGLNPHPDLPPVTLASVQAADGAANTLLLSENLDSGLWTAQREADLTFLWVARNKDGIPDPDGQLWRINEQGGQGQGKGKVMFARPSSRHRGGVNVVYADGHTEFLSDQLDYAVYTYKMTVDGNRLRQPGTDQLLGPPYQPVPGTDNAGKVDPGE